MNDAYLIAQDADLFFQKRLKAELWFESSYEDRNKALIQATFLIDNLNFAGDIAEVGQVLQFPRANTFQNSTKDVEIPVEIKNACCLIALKLLDGVDIDLEIKNLSMTQSKFHQVTANYDRNWVPEHLQAGIPSAEAWFLLKPFLRSINSVSLIRL